MQVDAPGYNWDPHNDNLTIVTAFMPYGDTTDQQELLFNHQGPTVVPFPHHPSYICQGIKASNRGDLQTNAARATAPTINTPDRVELPTSNAELNALKKGGLRTVGYHLELWDLLTCGKDPKLPPNNVKCDLIRKYQQIAPPQS